MTSLRTLIMGSLIILIGYTHISTTTAALGHLSQASAAHDQTDRPPREAATDGICDQPRPQYAFGADQSTHQLISIAQVPRRLSWNYLGWGAAQAPQLLAALEYARRRRARPKRRPPGAGL